jgi:hypothetical protein
VKVQTAHNTIDAVYTGCRVQTYANWELLVMGDKCPELEAFMEQHKQWFIGE